MGKRGASRVCRYVLNGLLAASFSPSCAACGRVLDRPLSGPICDDCWHQVRPVAGPRCRTCGDPLPSWRIVSVASEQCPRCRRRRGPVTAARAAGEYDGALGAIIRAFKYDGRRGLAGPLASLMRSAGADVLAGADATVPVPLHPWKRMRRGFNQADDLARHLGLPLVRALGRGRATSAQTGLTLPARRRNVRNAFRLSRGTRRARLDGRIVVLVDDVRTTGATLDACATVLRRAGTREVRALTVARATLHTTRS